MISRLVLWGRYPAGLLFIPGLGGLFQQVSPVDSRHVKRAMQIYNLLRSALLNPPKIIPFPHPHCFYALSIFLLVPHYDGGFTNFYMFPQYFVDQKPNKVSKIDFLEFSQMSHYPREASAIYLLSGCLGSLHNLQLVDRVQISMIIGTENLWERWTSQSQRILTDCSDSRHIRFLEESCSA